MEENAVIQLKNVTFSYDTDFKEASGVHNINLTIKKGEVVVLCGESGCGKTTITRLINGLIPNYYEGNLTGIVLVNEKNVSNQPLYETANQIGSVFQNPQSQFFNVDTTSEITFGCENLGVPVNEIAARLHQVTEDFHLHNLLGRSIFQLSGGQKQKIACAGISIMHPDIFVLDEPSSNMDAQSIQELQEILLYWKKQGKTIVISEHRLYYLRGLADRFLYMKDGKIKNEYDAEQFEQMDEQEREDLGLRTFCLENLRYNNVASSSNDIMKLQSIHFAYKNSPETLHVHDCQIPANRIVAIIGNNGAGKSTFSRCFCGLEKHCGEVIWNNTVLRPKDRLNICYMVMQDVNHQLFTESIQEEIAISMEQGDIKEQYSMDQRGIEKIKEYFIHTAV